MLIYISKTKKKSQRARAYKDVFMKYHSKHKGLSKIQLNILLKVSKGRFCRIGVSNLQDLMPDDLSGVDVIIII